jgi:serine/threonine protein kinase
LTWIDGLPLDELPPDLPVPDRRALVLQAALAVARLHGARVVHGDLAVANLIVRPHGEVAIVDFGLSPSSDGSVPPVEGTWEILPPERLQGGSPDFRWDVFALGVLGLRVLGALPPEADSRESWARAVGSGDLAKWARGRSWGLSLALEPDPANRPEDAAALVRLLEKDWGDPPLARSLLQASVDQRMERLLSRAIVDARGRRDWNSAWKIQRERIERSRSPEELLPELSQFQRLRSMPPFPHLRWIAAAAAAILLIAGGAIWWVRRPSDRPADLGSATMDPSPSYSDFSQGESYSDVLVFDPPPPGSLLRVDGKDLPVPRDGFLRLAPGTHQVELEDSTGESILDTTWVVLRRAAVYHHSKNTKSINVPSTAKKGNP